MLYLTSLKVLFIRLFSRPVLAPVFIGMRKISNLGLNYNAAAMLSVKISGEGKALDYIFLKLPHEQELTLFDVGASVGEYIEAFINRCPSAYRVRAFEPTSAALAILRRRYCENSGVKIFACGLSESQGEASIYFAYAGGNASLKSPNY
jgi:hypothetical protein